MPSFTSESGCFDNMEPSAAVVEKGTQFLADKICEMYNAVARHHNLPDPISRESIVAGIELKSQGKSDFKYHKLQAMPFALRVMESPSAEHLMAMYAMLSHVGLRLRESGFLDDEHKLFYILTNEKHVWGIAVDVSGLSTPFLPSI